MNRSTRKFRLSCSFNVIILAFFWTAALICGVYFAVKDPSVVFWMRLLSSSQVSIVGLGFVLFLPLLISIAAGYSGFPIAIYIISAAKGFLYGYCLAAISLTYSDACWLYRFFLLFSDSAMNVVLLWFWFKRVSYGRCWLRRDAIISAALAVVIGAIDYLVLSPFWFSIVN